MKNSPVLSLAIGTIKKDFKAHMMTFFMMILSFTFLFGSYYLIHGDTAIRNQKTIETFGKWSYCYQDLTKDEINEITNHRQYVSMVQVETTLNYKDDNTTYFGANYNGQFFKMASISLLQGHIPTQKNEIVITNVLPYAVDDQITINHQKYQVVGIINHYNQEWIEKGVDIFTYQQPTQHQRTYVEAKGKIYDTSDCVENLYRTRLSYTSTNEMNIFLTLVGIGIFVACFYDIDKTNERIVLLKSIGMSSRQTHGYLTLETLMIEFFAILISIPLGLLFTRLIHFIYLQETGYFLTSIDYLGTAKYYLGLILLTVFCIWSVIVYLEFRTYYDGLIVRKTHRQLKKYHKAYRMNTLRITQRLLKKMGKYQCAIVALSLIVLSLMTKVYMSDPQDYYRQMGSVTFHYDVYLEHEDEQFIQYLSNDLNAENIDNQNSAALGRCFLRGTQFSPFTLKQPTNNHKLIKGREIKTDNECIVSPQIYLDASKDGTFDKEEVYDIQLGDQIKVETLEGDKTYDYTVVGIMEDDDHEGKIIVNNQDDYQWTYNYSFEVSNQNVQFQLLSYPHVKYFDYSSQNLDMYQTTVMQLQCVKICVMLVVVMVLNSALYLFFKELFKEFNLFRCLGMTNVQVIKVLLTIYVELFALVLCFGYVLGFVRLDVWLMIVFFGILLFIPSVIMSNLSLKGGVHYRPSDVERFY